jgi:hypothetical protein
MRSPPDEGGEPSCHAGCLAVVNKEDDQKGEEKKPHTPGRGHRRKSAPPKKKRFQKKAAKKRRKMKGDLRKQWAEWDALPLEVQKLRPEKKPKRPRPTDEK